MTFSHIVDGVFCDVTMKSSSNGVKFAKGTYFVYLGKEYIGQAYSSRRGWSVVAAKPNPLGVLSGFKYKYQVFEYLLKIRDIDFSKGYP